MLGIDVFKEEKVTERIYEVSLETPNILESGSTFSRVAVTKDEDKAFLLLKDGRNRLERSMKMENGRKTEIYENGKWV